MNCQTHPICSLRPLGRSSFMCAIARYINSCCTMELFWALYYFFWLKVLISIDAKRQTFTAAELSPGPALCRTALRAGKSKCASWILTSLKWPCILFGTICFLVCTAPACLLLLRRDAQALLRWEAAQVPTPGGPSCPQPDESHPHSQDMEADKAFCRKTNDKKDDFEEQANCHVGPHLCGNLWKCFSYIHKKYSVRYSTLKF